MSNVQLPELSIGQIGITNVSVRWYASCQHCIAFMVHEMSCELRTVRYAVLFQWVSTNGSSLGVSPTPEIQKSIEFQWKLRSLITFTCWRGPHGLSGTMNFNYRCRLWPCINVNIYIYIYIISRACDIKLPYFCCCYYYYYYYYVLPTYYLITTTATTATSISSNTSTIRLLLLRLLLLLLLLRLLLLLLLHYIWGGFGAASLKKWCNIMLDFAI